MGCGASSRSKYVPRPVVDETVEEEEEEKEPRSSSKANVLTDVRLFDLYTIDSHSELGQGLRGTVKQATNKLSGRERAVRSLTKSSISRDEVEKEVELMRELDHPHIINLYEVFEDRRMFYIVMELCAGGHILQCAGSMSQHMNEGVVARWTEQLLRASSYMHGKSVCHRNLQQDNVLLRSQVRLEDDLVQSNVMIIDFNEACFFEAGVGIVGEAGTLQFMPPQMPYGRYTELCDIWTLGLLVFALLCGRLPWPACGRAADRERLADLNKRKGRIELLPGLWASQSSDAKHFVQQMLAYQEGKRISATEAIEHQWIQNRVQAAELTLDQSQLKNMCKFHSRNCLEKQALNIIAKRMDDAEIGRLKELFISLDDDNSGTITLNELAHGLEKMKAGKKNKDAPMDVGQLMESMDVNGTMEIEYTEFIAATLDRRQYHNEGLLWVAFREFDADGSGYITKQELREILSRDGVLDAEGLKAALKECDSSGDGKVSFDEFVTIMGGAPLAAPKPSKSATNDRPSCYRKVKEEPGELTAEEIKEEVKAKGKRR